MQEGPFLERCAQKYIKWRRSPPTSMGQATCNAFTADRASNQAPGMMARSALENSSSQSNRALMWASPLGIALSNQDDDTIGRFGCEPQSHALEVSSGYIASALLQCPARSLPCSMRMTTSLPDLHVSTSLIPMTGCLSILYQHRCIALLSHNRDRVSQHRVVGQLLNAGLIVSGSWTICPCSSKASDIILLSLPLAAAQHHAAQDGILDSISYASRCTSDTKACLS